MLVLLPPSETKASGGDGPPLRLDALSHPELTPTRPKLVDELAWLAGNVAARRDALRLSEYQGLSEHQIGELERNAALWTAPTLPALHRYTGVLYAALDTGSLRPAERARAGARLAVASALFGLLTAEDPIPAYRLSASSSLPGVGHGPRYGVWCCRSSKRVKTSRGARHCCRTLAPRRESSRGSTTARSDLVLHGFHRAVYRQGATPPRRWCRSFVARALLASSEARSSRSCWSYDVPGRAWFSRRPLHQYRTLVRVRQRTELSRNDTFLLVRRDSREPPLLAGVVGLVVDLRSGAYAALGPLPGAVTAYVLSEDGRGRRRTVSHHNKAHKGRLARLLATAPREVSDADGVARIAHRGGLRVERTGEHALDLIVPA